MKYIIILVIVAIVLWRAKPYIKGWLVSYKNKKRVIQIVEEQLVYVPITSSRVFSFAIEIKEVGGGKATISVIKDKNMSNI